MDTINKLESIAQFNAEREQPTLHPLVTVLDNSKSSPVSISEIAYEMGFKYPTHFTRLFKQKVGQSPNKYRVLN